MFKNQSIFLFFFFFFSVVLVFSQKTIIPTKDSINNRLQFDFSDLFSEKNTAKIGSVFFQSGEFFLDEEDHGKLNQLAEFLKKNQIMELLVVGHSDAKGDAIYNKALSKKRASEIKFSLISKGVSKKRIYVEAFGEMQLKNNCKDGIECPEELHALNRRVEFIVFSD